MTSCNLVIKCLLCTNGIYGVQFYPTGKAERTSSFLISTVEIEVWHGICLWRHRMGTQTQLLHCWTALIKDIPKPIPVAAAGLSHSPYFLRICRDNAQAACSISLQWNSMWKTTVPFQTMLVDMGLWTKTKGEFWKPAAEQYQCYCWCNTGVQSPFGYSFQNNCGSLSLWSQDALFQTAEID